MSFEISQIVIAVVVICMFLWRISYGTKNGLFAEATGLIAVIAAFVSVFYIATIAGNVLTHSIGSALPKAGFLLVAFAVYRIMKALGNALRGIKEIPMLGTADRIMGAVLGAAEALVIILMVQFITGIKMIMPVISMGNQLWSYALVHIEKLL